MLAEFHEVITDYRIISNDCFPAGTIYRFHVEGMLVEQVEHQYLNGIWKFRHSSPRCQGLVLLVVNKYTLDDDVVLLEAALQNDHYLNEDSFFLTPPETKASIVIASKIYLSQPALIEYATLKIDFPNTRQGLGSLIRRWIKSMKILLQSKMDI